MPTITFTGNGEDNTSPHPFPLVRLHYKGTTITAIYLLVTHRGPLRDKVKKAMQDWAELLGLKLELRTHRNLRRFKLRNLESQARILGGALNDEFGNTITLERRFGNHLLTSKVEGTLPKIRWQRVK